MTGAGADTGSNMETTKAASRPDHVPADLWAVLDEHERSWELDQEPRSISFEFTYEGAESLLSFVKSEVRLDLANVPCTPGQVLHHITMGWHDDDDAFDQLAKVDFYKWTADLLEELRDRLA